jgi:peptidoglycan/xylan/chitin deacetylase (PgdA/CDA1 family)
MNKGIIICSIVLLLGNTLHADEQKVVFRYDDFTLRNDSINDKIISIFIDHDIPLVLGVIPCGHDENLIIDPDYSQFVKLKNAVNIGLFEIALHGLTHEQLDNGEFGNVPYKEQYRRLAKGKFLLDSVFRTNVQTFIPPWNVYDDNTLKALDALSFRSISSSMTIDQPVSNKHINYYPHTLDSPKLLLKAMEDNKNRNGIIVLMFHPYDFNKEFTADSLENILIRISNNREVEFTTFAGLLTKNNLSDAKRINANLETNLLTKLLKTRTMIQKTSYTLFLRITNLFLYMVISIFTFSFSRFLLGMKSVKMNVIFSVLLILMGITVWIHLTGPLKLLLVAISLPILTVVIFKIVYVIVNSGNNLQSSK